MLNQQDYIIYREYLKTRILAHIHDQREYPLDDLIEDILGEFERVIKKIIEGDTALGPILKTSELSKEELIKQIERDLIAMRGALKTFSFGLERKGMTLEFEQCEQLIKESIELTHDLHKKAWDSKNWNAEEMEDTVRKFNFKTLRFVKKIQGTEIE